MNNSFKVIEKTKGYPLALHDDYQYRKYRTNNANIITWVCLNEKKDEKCKGRLRTTGNKVVNVTNHKFKYDFKKFK
jgi:hypothetical protein